MAEFDFIGHELQGRYRILGVLGRGGMGTVYRAAQLSTGQNVAVKVLHSELMSNQDSLHRFRLEAQAITRLRHPNTLKLIDLGELDDGRLYLVTELLTGRTLDLLMEKGWPVGRLLLIMAQVSEALAEAHDAGIAHRDIKPSNIMVEIFGRREVAKILDFGIAKLGDQPKLTATGAVFGTPSYMSPEQAGGEPVGAASDMYSIGIILFQILSGTLPFSATGAGALLVKHLTEMPPQLSSLVEDVDPELEQLVSSMLQKKPEARPQSLLDVAAILEAAASRIGDEGTLPPILTNLSLPPAAPATYPHPNDLISRPFVSYFPNITAILSGVLLILLLMTLGLWRLGFTLSHPTLIESIALEEAVNSPPSTLVTLTPTASTTPKTEVERPPALASSPRKHPEPAPPQSPPKPQPTPTRSPPLRALTTPSSSDPNPISRPQTAPSLDPRPLNPRPVPNNHSNVPEDMIFIPAGRFAFGCSQPAHECSSDEIHPIKAIYTQAFYIDKTEVTAANYQACVLANRCRRPKYGKLYNGKVSERSLHPINGVTWKDAWTYCRWKGLRLPTEEEWEKAARGTDGRIYPWGESAEAAQLANVAQEQDGFINTAPVGSFPDGASPFGLLDMAGNVWEWTMSRHKPNGTNRIIRGGSWYGQPRSARVYTRVVGPPKGRAADVGFRCAKSASKRPLN